MTVSPLSGVLIQGPCIHHAGDGVPVISHDEVAALDVEWLECDTSGWRTTRPIRRMTHRAPMHGRLFRDGTAKADCMERWRDPRRAEEEG